MDAFFGATGAFLILIGVFGLYLVVALLTSRLLRALFGHRLPSVRTPAGTPPALARHLG